VKCRRGGPSRQRDSERDSAFDLRLALILALPSYQAGTTHAADHDWSCRVELRSDMVRLRCVCKPEQDARALVERSQKRARHCPRVTASGVQRLATQLRAHDERAVGKFAKVVYRARRHGPT